MKKAKSYGMGLGTVGVAIGVAAVLSWQRYGPHTPELKAGKFPEQIVSVRSEDSIVNGGVMFYPPDDARKSVAVIWIHGWGVNFYQPTYVNIGRELAARGYACIAGNTRMHDLGNVLGQRDGKRLRGGGYWGVASDEVRDVAAWIDLAEAKGFKQVVLVGHSAGWSAVRNYQATKQDPRVVGVVLASGAVRAETRPTNMKMLNTATNLISIGRGDDLLRIAGRSFPSFISADTFADIANTAPGQKDFFGMQGTNADVTRIHCPLLAFFGTREGNIGTEEQLKAMKAAVERLPTRPNRVDITMIKGADHMYAGEEEQVAETISRWVGGFTVQETAHIQARAAR